MISASLRISDMSLLTDSQILATLLNGSDLDKPPQWEIKPYTQKFLNAMANCNWKVFKVKRELNTTAHILANQASRASQGSESIVHSNCTNPDHVDSCPLSEALMFVNWENLSPIAAVCC